MPTKTVPVIASQIALPDLDHKLYEALRDDIQRRGVLVPVIRDATTNEVIDGKIRLAICQELGLRDVPTIFLGKLTAKDRQEIRHSLNCYRRHLTRSQIQAATEWAVRSTPHESDRKIAGRVGVDKNTVKAARFRVGEVHQQNRIGKDGKSYASQKPSVYTANKGQRESIRRNLVELGEEAPGGAMTPRKLRKLVGRKERDALAARNVSLPTTFKVECCDFRNHSIPASSIDLCYCDLPWTSWTVNRLDYARENFKILKPGGLAVCYFGHQGLIELVEVFKEAGFVYRWIVAGINQDGCGSCSYFGSILSAWRPIVILQKGGPRFRCASLMFDVLRTTDRDKSLHCWQQPVSEANSLIRGLTGTGATVADLTCCTGTSGVACAQIGSRKYHGVEIDPDLCKLARSRIDDELKLRK